MILNFRDRKLKSCIAFLASVWCLHIFFKWKGYDLLPKSVNLAEGVRNFVGRSTLSDYDQADDANYVQDKNGYFYPKAYFDLAIPGVSPSFKDVDLRGRHSDSVVPVCKNFTYGAGPEIQEVYDYRVPRFNFSKNFKNPCWYENTSLRCMPYFFLIGTVKSGTFALNKRLRKHPDVVDWLKEHRFWDRERFKKLSWAPHQYYLSSFYEATNILQRAKLQNGYNKMVFGDGSPTYIFNNIRWFRFPGNEGCLEPRITCVSYIHNMNPHAKLLLIMRNPVDRLYSSYLYNYVRTGCNRTAEEFHDWATKSVNAHLDCFQKHPFRACLYSKEIVENTVLTLSAGIYSRLILDVLKLFPREQLHVIKMEDYSADIPKYMKKVYEFLELSPMPQREFQQMAKEQGSNKGKDYNHSGLMLPKTRKLLHDFYEPFNKELAYILKDDTYNWPENS